MTSRRPLGRRRRLREFAALTVAALVAAVFMPAPADAVTRSQDACHTTGTGMPHGDCGPFHQVFADDFNDQHVPLGAFSSCAGDGDFHCAGLKKYGAVYRQMGAYPRGWYDTANPKNHSNGNDRSFGGEYRADDTTWIAPSAWGDGQLHVRMYRPSSGDNHVSAPVPLGCMNIRYGKFSERWRVHGTLDGFKMAHLHYGDASEVDFPEAGGNFADDPISAFVHDFTKYGTDAGGAKWTTWHTSTYEITPSGVTFYLDGKEIGHVAGNDPDTTPWVLQNESSLSGDYAARGSSVTIDTTWVTCYTYRGTT
ncbi:glycosyl hydrolase family 16 [Streptomyces sp. NPDC093261]|uniref:glycosyl hydrolase family 16 n=1 Tax=Streptomyces sp. NPDC093261 TaxID=3366037 RepID=UPI003808C94C